MQWLAAILTVLFVVAKLMGIVTWSWWLVFAPAIIYLVLGILVLAIVTLLALLS